MSNTRPSDIEMQEKRIDKDYRRHILEAERDRALFFQKDPRRNPTGTAAFKDVDLIQLKGSGLWVTEGEITALADYLPDGEEINSLPADRLLRIL